MKLEHVALSITVPEDVKNFYQDIFGMSKIKGFVLNKSLANDIFGINKDTEVFLLQKDLLFFEIFVVNTTGTHNFNHLCLALDDRKSVFETAQQKGYSGIYKQRESSELFFLKDKSGNVFELKEKN